MFAHIIACLALIQPYESEVRSGMPGNASEFRFEDCRIDGESVYVRAHARARQNVCKWGRCVTVWSYTSKVLANALVDDNCDLRSVRVWTEPNNPVLDPLIPQVEDGIARMWPEVKKEHSELCP